MELDFSSLTDDQLIGLIQQAAAEAVQRGEAVAASARYAGLSEAEKARAENAAYETEIARIRAREAEEATIRGRARARKEVEATKVADATNKEHERWQKRAELAAPFVELLGEGWQLTVWERGGDKRVYLDKGNHYKITYYITGNSYHPPGEMEWAGDAWKVVPGLKKEVEKPTSREKYKKDAKAINAWRPRLLEQLKVAATWGAGLRLDLDQAVSYKGAES